MTALKILPKVDGCTHSGKVTLSLGGVGRNIADCLTRLGMKPYFFTCVGDDLYGEMILTGNPELDKTGVHISPSCSTAKCSVVLNSKKECEILVGDFSIHSQINVEMLSKYEGILKKAPIVIVDANIPIETLDFILQFCFRNEIPVWYEPTDIKKADFVFQSSKWTAVTFASPNLHELRVMARAAGEDPGRFYATEKNPIEEEIKRFCLKASAPLMDSFRMLLVTLGSLGVMTITRKGDNILGKPMKHRQVEMEARYFPPINSTSNVVSVLGAGDCMAAGIISSILNGLPLDECIPIGLRLAQISLSSPDCVPNSISPKLLHAVK